MVVDSEARSILDCRIALQPTKIVLDPWVGFFEGKVKDKTAGYDLVVFVCCTLLQHCLALFLFVSACFTCVRFDFVNV